MAGKGNYKAYIYDTHKMDKNNNELNLKMEAEGKNIRYVIVDVQTIPVNVETYKNWNNILKSDKKRVLKKWIKQLVKYKNIQAA